MCTAQFKSDIVMNLHVHPLSTLLYKSHSTDTLIYARSWETQKQMQQIIFAFKHS